MYSLIFPIAYLFQLTRSRGAWHSGEEVKVRFVNFNSHAHVERDYTTGAGTAIVFNFNSHAHVERDQEMKKLYMNLQDFNSHAHVERDNFWGMERLNRNNFNSHAHVERDMVMITEYQCRQKFQLTRSRGAWQYAYRTAERCDEFQLTRSRGAWPCKVWCAFLDKCISTHTLT